MGHSERLRLGEVRAVFHLVGEVRELGDDAMAWRRHLAERMARLLGARIVITGEQSGTVGPGLPTPIGYVDIGWADDRERDYFLGYVIATRWDDIPQVRPHFDRLAALGGSCRLRRQLTDDRTWYRWLAEVEMPSTGDQDDCIMAGRRVPAVDGEYHLSLHRAWGDPLFAERDRRTVALLLAELARLWEPEPGRADPLAEMPTRWRQTLARLEGGDSEKEVAVRLGISRHTVHTYVKGLYRHFGVSSRGELLAHCRRLARRDDFRPRLVLAQGCGDEGR